MSASAHKIFFRLQRAAHRLKTEADAALVETGGLTTAQAAVMSIIIADGPVTQKHIADILQQRESAVTAMVARLRKAGYVARTRSATDARAWALEATDAGRAADARIRTAFKALNEKLDQLFPDAEMDSLAEKLTRIMDTF